MDENDQLLKENPISLLHLCVLFASEFLVSSLNAPIETNDLTSAIIGTAIEVNRSLESARWCPRSLSSIDQLRQKG